VTHPWLSNIRNDITGGVISAVVAIPLAIGYGMFAFVPLGDAYFAYGVLAGLYAAFIVAMASVALGDKTTTVYAPRIVTTFFLSAIIVHSLSTSDAAIIRSGNVELIIAIVFSVVLLGGLFQMLFGLMRIGTLIKYMPHTVMSGFQNAAALLLFLVQIGTVLGYAQHMPIFELANHLAATKPLNVLVALLTFAAMWHAKKFAPKVPPVVSGLAAGTAAYYVLVLAGFAADLGPVMGATPVAHLSPSNLPDFIDLVRDPGVLEVAPAILSGALGLAIIASVDALLCARLLQTSTGTRRDTDRQLVRLGLGNMLSASCGGITSGINIGPSLANRAYGARTPLSVLVNAAVVLLTLIALLPLIAHLPRVVLSGVILVIAVQHIDPWTIELVKRLFAPDVANRPRVVLELFVIVLVATVSIAMNIVIAVFIGIVVAILFFLLRMSRSVIRRAYRCDGVHSRRTRTPQQAALLTRHGGRILVVELEGALFFGTADSLEQEIEAALQETTSYLILDLKRVTEIDSTGARLILKIHDRLTRNGQHFVIAHLEEHSPLERFLRDMGVTAAVSRGRIFLDTDHAIEWAEDKLIFAEIGDAGTATEFPFSQLDVLAGFAAEDLAIIRTMLQRRSYAKGEVVFREGDSSAELFIIAHGSASVRIRLDEEHQTRLITFSPGTVFGEIALLDQEMRSASVLADENLVCYVLTRADFLIVSRQYPFIAIKLLANLARELSSRLRRANRTIYQLAS
jgi:anti-anti-sigma factor